MTNRIIHDFFQILKDDNIAFSYRGNFSNTVLAMATNLFKNNLNEEHSKLRNKLSFLMIESFQNIARYADSDKGLSEPDELSDYFMTRNVGDSFYIISSNLIDNGKVDSLKERLDRVNSLDKKELNMLYREVLMNRQISEKGGAGLGFIEMVRKSKDEIPYEFIKVNDEKSMFFMQIHLSQKKKEQAISKVELKDAQKIWEEISKESILLMHKGNYSQEAVGPMLRMVESNMQDMQLKLQKKVYHFLVEILQNISKHSYKIEGEREGIFLIGLKDKHFNIGTGNYIANKDIKALKTQLDLVNSLSTEELSNLYRKYLREGRNNDEGSAGLGLIDLARETEDKINYEFFPVKDDYSFYTLTVKF
ncbi:MAG: SiaB family protein kinase [Bacteroidota bacterium]|nr:SiaB family protein kinase [Bacteroidota bacterium]